MKPKSLPPAVTPLVVTLAVGVLGVVATCFATFVALRRISLEYGELDPADY